MKSDISTHYPASLLEPGYIARHKHSYAYAAIVLGGQYSESGDSGRFVVGPGDILIHHVFDSHSNQIGSCGARILNLPLLHPIFLTGAVSCPDLDYICKVAEFDTFEASLMLTTTASPIVRQLTQWPDCLAHTIRLHPNTSISAWARAQNLAPETVSRGFRRAYGISPASYRKIARAKLALSCIASPHGTFADIAQMCGFSDQAHLTRSITALTGSPPGVWKQQVKFVQDASSDDL
jgi:AraC-like DNA-binding protein